MRDLERWKDKVEISLDGRQIFFLFFGSAVAVCLIFVLGVLIGKRIEARALALQPPPIEDPLAALDQLGDADDEGLTFHKALAPDKGEKKAPKPAEGLIRGEDAPPRPEPKATKPEAKQDPKIEAKAEPAEETKQPEAKASSKTAEIKLPTLKATPEVRRIELPDPPRPLPPSRPQVVPAATPKREAVAKRLDAAATHFTLQLSAFPDKADAEEFMHKMQAAGYKPYMVASEIPGKGVFWRVRIGDYGTRQSALDAKSDFERKQRIIAYVAKL